MEERSAPPTWLALARGSDPCPGHLQNPEKREETQVPTRNDPQQPHWCVPSCSAPAHGALSVHSTPTAEGRGPPLKLHPQPAAKGPDNVTWQPPRRHLDTSQPPGRVLGNCHQTQLLCVSPENDVAGVSPPPVRASADITAGGNVGMAGLLRPPTLLMTHEATYLSCS